MKRSVLIAAAVLPLLLAIVASAAYAQGGNFTVIEVHWTNRAGGHSIYPGSRGVTYVVTVKYTGSESIEDVVACLVNPPYLTPSDGYSLCAVAETPSRTPAATVNPGDEIIFVYHLDVSRDAKPGLYGLTLKVSYRVVATGAAQDEYIPGALIYISPYPSPRLRVLDVYWKPGGYPGTQDAALHVVLENIGPRITSGYAWLVLVNRSVFSPSILRARLGPVGERQTLDLSFQPISLNTSAPPGVYVAYLKLHLSMETEDGVQYDTYAVLRLEVRVSEPQPVNVTLADYGLVGLAAPGSRGAAIYATLINREPGVTIEAIYAKLVITGGATGYNGSRIIYASSGTRIPYGSSVTITFRDITVENATITAVLDVEMLVSRDGAEYWVRRTWSLAIRAHWEPGVKLLGYGWSSTVYPGTAEAEYTVVLGVEGYERVAGGYATLSMPRGFQPHMLHAIVPGAAPGSTLVLRFNGISVASSLRPGCYKVNLTLSLLLVDEKSGARRNATLTLPLLACIERPPANPLRLISVWWDNGVAYSNSTGNVLAALIVNDKPGVTVEAAVVSIILPSGLSQGGYRVINETLGRLSYGSTVRLTIRDISVSEWTHGRLPVAIIVRGYASLDGSEYNFTETLTGWVTVEKPKLNITLAYYSWEGLVSNGTVGARIRAVLTSSSLDAIDELRVEWLPVRGAVLLEPGVQVLDVNMGFGSSIALTSPRLWITSPVVVLRLRIYARLTQGSASYTAAKSYTLLLYANSTLPKPVIEHIEVLYNGEPAVLAPGQRGVTLRILFYNPSSYTIASMSGWLIAPQMRVEQVSGSCINGVAPGSVCSLDFTLNISRYLAPGVHPALLTVRYSIAQNGYTSSFTASYAFNLTVSAPSSLAPRLVVASVYWGVGRPEPVYPHAGLTPVTVTVINAGRWEARGVTVAGVVDAPGMEPVASRAVCAATLAPGAACTATLYYLVGSVKPGFVRLRITVSQIVYTYGLDYNETSASTVYLRVLPPPMGGGVRLVDARWENDWPVYPGTRNAVYQVTVANLEPYQLLGVNLTLIAPRGIRAKSAYIPGPIDPGAEATANLRLGISEGVKPGCYRATLVITYALRVSGSTGSIVEETPVKLCISDPRRALSLISVYWAGGATGSGSMGARLLIILRNDEVPQMSGIVAKVVLPPGMSFAPTNETLAVVPVTVATAGQPSIQPAVLEKLLSAVGGGSTQPGGSTRATVAPKGSFIVVEVPVNIYSVKPGYHTVRIEIDYIDQWGSRHSYETVTRVRVLGAPHLLEASLPPLVDVSGGYAKVSMRVTNIGTGPVYSVYVYLVPRIPLLLPQPAIFYIPRLGPGETKTLNLTLYYNPKGLATWGQSSGPSYTAVVFTIGFVYSDAAGALHATNYTAVVQVEPFVKLQLGPDTKAEWRNGTLTVGGTVVNTGTATARSVEIRVYADGKTGYTFLGDLDPGDQTAFRIDIRLHSPVRRVNLTIYYLDEYNRMHRLVRILPVRIIYATGGRLENSAREGSGIGGLGALQVALPLAAVVAAASLFTIARRVKR